MLLMMATLLTSQLVSNPVGVQEAGLGLRVGVTGKLNAAVTGGGGVENVTIDPVRRPATRVGDDGVHKFVVRGGDAVEV